VVIPGTIFCQQGGSQLVSRIIEDPFSSCTELKMIQAGKRRRVMKIITK
jgi:hypothetical protein